MKVLVVGAGPAGLTAATLLAASGRCRHIDVIERGAASETPGWGITLRNDALSQLGLDGAVTVRQLAGRALWYQGRPVVDLSYPPGTHLVTMSRAALLRVLRARCADAGVTTTFDTAFASLPEPRLATYDLIVAADGASSAVRRRHQSAFGVTVRSGRNWYAWLGTTAPLRTLSIFLRNDDTPLLAWAYQYSDRLSTLIVECTDSTFRQHQLAAMAPADCAAMLAKRFERELGGAKVFADAPVRWQQFQGLSCRRLFHDNVVLIGDAAHTTHFSQGFGTAFAFDDAVALDAALTGSSDLTAALAAFESSQQPKVDAFQLTATQSMEWAEGLISAAEDRDEQRVRTLIAARWANNAITRSPFSAPPGGNPPQTCSI